MTNIEGHPNLIKNLITGAIICNDIESYELYHKKIISENKTENRIKKLESSVASLNDNINKILKILEQKNENNN